MIATPASHWLGDRRGERRGEGQKHHAMHVGWCTLCETGSGDAKRSVRGNHPTHQALVAMTTAAGRETKSIYLLLFLFTLNSALLLIILYNISIVSKKNFSFMYFLSKLSVIL